MKRFTFLLSCLVANLYLFGQGGSGTQVNEYYLYGNNAAFYYPNPIPGQPALPQYTSNPTGHTDLVALINQPNPDLQLCEKQFLEVGITPI
jgi:hypothetical protein